MANEPLRRTSVVILEERSLVASADTVVHTLAFGGMMDHKVEIVAHILDMVVGGIEGTRIVAF